MDGDRADERAARGSRSRRSPAGPAADRALGRAVATSRAPSSTWRPTRRTTSRAASSPWTGATLPASRPRAGLAHGPGRAPARAHFRAMGIDPDRLDGPVVGIASTWTGTMPCNLTQRELAAQVAEAVTAAGGVPLEFNTIAVSDNQSQGTPGMRASLVSREVIADSIELMVHAHDFDAVVCLVGCDKTTPGGADGARAPRQAGGRPLQRADARRAGGRPRRHDPGRLGGRRGVRARAHQPRGARRRSSVTSCPGPGTCAGHFTANTMAVALDCLGLGVVGDGLIPADDREAKAGAAARAGRLAVERAMSGPAARDVPRPAGPAQRHGRGGGHRRLHQRAAAPAGHRPRGGRGGDARRAGGGRRRHAGDRQPRAVRPLRRRGHAPGGRDARRDPGARSRAGTSTATRRRCRAARWRSVTAGRPGPGRARARRRRDAVQARAARCSRCAATSRRTGPW